MSDGAERWRLLLGRYAEQSLPSSGFGRTEQDIESTLGFLYDREYRERGLRLGGGSLDPSALAALSWVVGARRLFPRETFERLQVEAIERYGIVDLLADDETARSLEPSRELATALLGIRGTLDASLERGVRTVIDATVADIVRRVRPRFEQAVRGVRSRTRSPQRISQNFDWRATIRANLKNAGAVEGRLLVDDLRFVSRVRRRLPWDVVILVDQSGSMASSVMYSAVCASILAALPGIRVTLLLFDTSVVDLTHLADDPVGVLLTAQLGGGTDIASAIGHAEGLVSTPSRTVVAVVSDFEEGGSVTRLLATVERLRASGVTMLGLAALDEEAEPRFDRVTAASLAARGMSVAALTPEKFGEWLGSVMG